MEGGNGVALGVFGDHFQDVAELAVADEGLGFLDHGIAGVVVGQGEDFAAFGNDVLHLAGFVEVEGEGFFANDIDSGLEKKFGDREMEVVANHDADEVDAVAFGQGGFFFSHFLIAGVDARGVEEEVLAGGFGFFGVGGKSAGDEFDFSVEVGGHAVDGADEGSAASADHSHFEFAIHEGF